ncbi:MAG: right-handed parallel beta-helix repeat-containing protein [Rubrivivax sp.]|nr:right-handed parallel beta-helix repeat-containing protein [Rubrivivax sp.]
MTLTAKPLCTVLASLALLAGCTSTPSSAAVWIVDPSSARASDTGPGNASTPLRSLAEAARRLQPGDTLRIARGVYREPLVLPRRAWNSSTRTVIERLGTGGEVLIKGSAILSGWQKSSQGVLSIALQTEPQQVFVGGRALAQIGGTIFGGFPEVANHELAALHQSQGGIWPARVKGDQSRLVEGSFHYNRASATLFVRSAVALVDGSNIEVSQTPHLLLADDVADLTIRNLSFEHSNTTTTSRRGAVAIKGSRVLVEGIKVRLADGKCLSLNADDSEVRRSSFDQCGQLGIGARGRNIAIRDNLVRNNNTRGFNKWWEAGGMKFTGDGGLRDSRVERNLVSANRGDGIWFDWGNEGNLIATNTTAFNSGFGIQYEASSRATIADNRSYGNGQRGIYVVDSHSVDIVHNFSAGNGLEGIAVVKERAAQGSGELDFRPFRIKVMGNLVAWNKGSALVLPGPEYTPNTDWNALVESGSMPARYSMGWPKVSGDRKTFTDWQRSFGADLSSRQYRAEPSPTVTNHLRSSSTAVAVPWAELKALTADYLVPAAVLNASTVASATGSGPGPRQ